MNINICQSAAKGLFLNSIKYGDFYTVFENGVIINKKGKELSFSDNGNGYLIISLYINGNRTTKALHRILAECFLENPYLFSDVDHIDGDRRNNKLSNLRWIDHGGNIKHSYDLSNRSAIGVNNARCVTTEEDVHKICELLQKGHTCVELRDVFGYTYHIVRAIKIRKNWTHISCNYSW